MKFMQRKTKITVLFVLFELLVLCSFYLYSLRSDLFPWGAPHDDALYMLAYFFGVLPIMTGISVAKIFFEREKTFLRYTLILYCVIISLPAMINFDSSIVVNSGVVICILVAVVNVWEFLFTFKKKQ